MSNIRKKQRIEIRLPEVLAAQALVAAESIGLSLPAFINMAVAAYVKRFKPPTDNRALYSPCSMCGKQHDREEHFRNE